MSFQFQRAPGATFGDNQPEGPDSLPICFDPLGARPLPCRHGSHLSVSLVVCDGHAFGTVAIRAPADRPDQHLYVSMDAAHLRRSIAALTRIAEMLEDGSTPR